MALINSRSLCSGCRQLFEKVKKCGRCQIIFYCSSECQKAHWSEHKKICQKPETRLATLKTREVHSAGYAVLNCPGALELYSEIKSGESKEMMIFAVADVDESYKVIENGAKIFQALLWSDFQQSLRKKYHEININDEHFRISVNCNHEQGLADMQSQGMIPAYIVLAHPTNGPYPIATSIGSPN